MPGASRAGETGYGLALPVDQLAIGADLLELGFKVRPVLRLVGVVRDCGNSSAIFFPPLTWGELGAGSAACAPGRPRRTDSQLC